VHFDLASTRSLQLQLFFFYANAKRENSRRELGREKYAIVRGAYIIPKALIYRCNATSRQNAHSFRSAVLFPH
jgi:hypothetical protein